MRSRKWSFIPMFRRWGIWSLDKWMCSRYPINKYKSIKCQITHRLIFFSFEISQGEVLNPFLIVKVNYCFLLIRLALHTSLLLTKDKYGFVYMSTTLMITNNPPSGSNAFKKIFNPSLNTCDGIYWSCVNGFLLLIQTTLSQIASHCFFSKERFLLFKSKKHFSFIRHLIDSYLLSINFLFI